MTAEMDTAIEIIRLRERRNFWKRRYMAIRRQIIRSRRERSPWWLPELYAELNRARAKFPGSALSLTAFSEEAGEVVKAVLDRMHGKPDTVSAELIQVMAMAVRLLEEGDRIHALPPDPRGPTTCGFGAHQIEAILRFDRMVEECAWVQGNHRSSEEWGTACGNFCFLDRPDRKPQDSGIHFCPGCGRKIFVCHDEGLLL